MDSSTRINIDVGVREIAVDPSAHVANATDHTMREAEGPTPERTHLQCAD